MTARITTLRIKPQSFPIHLDRDKAGGWPCPYCWQIMMKPHRFPTWDHVVPKAQGGPDLIDPN